MRAFYSTALRRALFAQLRLPRDAQFAVAYSGGCDSHVLLHSLMVLRDSDAAWRDLQIHALHFDHGANEESAQWARHCAAVCREWGIAFAQHRAVIDKRGGESWEARARAMRYRWFADALSQTRAQSSDGAEQVLLTAHHADDQAETVLLNLMRGGGVAALAGIAPLRALPATSSRSMESSSSDSNMRVARPLLDFPRAALEDYARRQGLSWIDDPSNDSLAFDRNFIRHSILPLLRERWSNAPSSLTATAAHCRDAAAFIFETMAPMLLRCQRTERRGVFCLAPPLDLDALARHSSFERIALLRAWLHQCGLRSPSSAQLQTLLQQAIDDDCPRASLRWDDYHLRRFKRCLHLTRQLDEGIDDAIAWDLRARDLRRNGLRVELAPADADDAADDDIALLDPALCRGRLTLAWRVGGERMKLPGRAHSNAVKKLFQQRAVPPWERAALPLLLRDGEVAWAHGVGAAAAYCARGAGGMRLRFVAGVGEGSGG